MFSRITNKKSSKTGKASYSNSRSESVLCLPSFEFRTSKSYDHHGTTIFRTVKYNKYDDIIERKNEMKERVKDNRLELFKDY